MVSLAIKRSESQSSGGLSSGIAFTYTLTDHAEIATITRWLDVLPIVQTSVRSCPARPANMREEQITFLGRHGQQLARATQTVSVPRQTTACDAMAFTIRRRPQPALLDGPRFLAKVNRLVGGPSLP